MNLPVNEVVRTGGKWVRPKIIKIPPMFGNDPYITRYVLFRTPWFGIYIHEIHAPDLDRDLHNHPREFWSFVIRGGYIEQVIYSEDGLQDGEKTHLSGSFHKMRITMFHGIKSLFRIPTWTLLLVGKEHQTWGFATPDGFIPAKEYKEFIEQKGQ